MWVPMERVAINPRKDARAVPVQERQMKKEVLEARRKFRRVLCAWAGDALALRRSGLDRPTFAMVGQQGGRLTGVQAGGVNTEGHR